MEVNQKYNGWQVLSVDPVAEYKSTGVWLRHLESGMEVFHLVNDDEENLFSFGFKTIPENSRGVAHILEHSVLCGSEKYPLKDPFLQLTKQTINTFLNAMTFPDKTVYPASSMIEADYFKLMSVYGDAVFFPRLDKEIFLQEGWHYEVDENDALVVKGVVYNEMKGNYSSFDSVAGDAVISSIMPDTAYALDSGGHPAEIPDLSYEEFCAFHKKYYAPSNCRLFLYGNIATEKQLDFLNSEFLARFGFSGKESCCSATEVDDSALIQPAFSEPRILETTGPAGNEDGDCEKGSTVLINWLLDETCDPVNSMEAGFAEELLMGHDGCPLTRALSESDLGEDIAPSAGLETELRSLIFTAGLRGVKKENAAAVEKLVLDVIRDLCDKGFDPEAVDAAVHAVEFADREIKRGHGPYSLTIMRRCYRGWMNGSAPVCTLQTRGAFEKVKARMNADPDYLVKLMRRLFLDNRHRALVTITPEESFDQTLEKACADKIAQADSPEIRKRILADQEALRIFQQREETPEESRLIPHLKPCELPLFDDKVNTKESSLGGIPFFSSDQPTNGIVYVDVAFPVDTVPVEDYPYLSFFSEAVTCVGAKGMDWAELSGRWAQVAGGFQASLSSCGSMENEKNPADPVLNRNWIMFSLKMLEELSEDGVNLLFDVLESIDFSDEKRLKNLLLEYRNDMKSMVVPMGNSFAGCRSSAGVSLRRAQEELWNGLSQVFFADRMVKMSTADLKSKFESIFAAMISSGVVVNVVAEQKNIERMAKVLEKRLAGYKAPYAVPETDKDAVIALIDRLSDGGVAEGKGEWFNAGAQVGYAATVLPAAGFYEEESVRQEILCSWLSRNYLWEQIRVIGGAYGASAVMVPRSNFLSLSSYRDPDPAKSLEVFGACFEHAAQHDFSDEEVEKAVTAFYSKALPTFTPHMCGTQGFLRRLVGEQPEMRQKRKKLVLETTADQLHQAAVKLAETAAAQKASNSVVVFRKSENMTGKIISLPL